MFAELLDRLLQRRAGWPEDKAEAAEQLMDRAFHRARGAILLDRIEELNEQRFPVQPDVTYARRSRQYISRLVLRALENIIHLAPNSDGRVHLDDVGICLLEGVDPHEFEYALTRLQGDGLVEGWSIGDKPGSRTLRATNDGLRAADKVSAEERAPSFLVEELIAECERRISRHSPRLVEKLRELSVRVMEARELSEHDVGEVAHSCELVIQDFLDLDVLWEGIDEQRPAKEKTRNRLRAVLAGKCRSDTEQDLLEALEEHVVGWFIPFETFVHKHRHRPEGSDRRHAERCLVYTYMLIGDFSDLLGL